MKLALSNLSFIGFEYTALRNLPAGMGLEIFYEFGDDFYWEQVMQEIYRDRLRQRLSIHAPCVGLNLADKHNGHYLPIYDRVFQFAAKWQVDYVVGHTNETFDGDNGQAREQVKQRLREILALAEIYNVRLLIENVGIKNKGTLLFDGPEYLTLLAELPQAGALLDIGHAYLNGWALPDMIQRLGQRLIACHVHDNHGLWDEHLPVGCGSVNWQAAFDAIHTYAAETTLVFEYANVKFEHALANIRTVNDRYLNGLGSL